MMNRNLRDAYDAIHHNSTPTHLATITPEMIVHAVAYCDGMILAAKDDRKASHWDRVRSDLIGSYFGMASVPDGFYHSVAMTLEENTN